MKMTLRTLLTVSVISMFCLPPCAWSFEGCGELKNHYGPFDYWTDKDRLPIVETVHFTVEIETLKSGKTSTLGGDIGYTLRAFPNHPKALMAMMQLGEKLKNDQPPGAGYPVFCYFERAIRFRPEDATARMMYGVYLAKKKKHEAALTQLETAEKFAGENANLHYNLGLVYFDLGKYDQSLRHAQMAYRMGFPLPGLRAKLEKAGQWQDFQPVIKPDDVDANSSKND